MAERFIALILKINIFVKYRGFKSHSGPKKIYFSLRMAEWFNALGCYLNVFFNINTVGSNPTPILKKFILVYVYFFKIPTLVYKL